VGGEGVIAKHYTYFPVKKTYSSEGSILMDFSCAQYVDVFLQVPADQKVVVGGPYCLSGEFSAD